MIKQRLILFLLLWSSAPASSSAGGDLYSLAEMDVENGTTLGDTLTSLSDGGPRPHHMGCGHPAIRPNIPGCSPGLGIIGGQTSVAHSWPWQASLQASGSHVCGGTLIGKYWVVTAASCKASTSHRVVLGQHDLRNTNGIQSKSIAQVFKHPKYNAQTHDFDIALIKLNHPAQINSYVSPVCVAETCDNYHHGTNCVATGWGLTRYSPERTPATLRQACLPLWSFQKCKRYFANRHAAITSQMFCAGANGAETCQGDGGGPLICKKNGAWMLFGITSWGVRGCDPHTPGVYSAIPWLRAWMDRTMADN